MVMLLLKYANVVKGTVIAKNERSCVSRRFRMRGGLMATPTIKFVFDIGTFIALPVDYYLGEYF